MVELEPTNRWWVLHDEAIVDALRRVEADTVTASEAHALLLEHSDIEEEA